MSATQGKKPPKECVKFEPQTWRKNLCKNCFKTADQHGGGDSSKADKDNAKDTAKIKDKAPHVDTAGKKSGGSKLGGDASATGKKGILDKGKESDTKSVKDKLGDTKKDKDKKPLFGKFADKAKEKVIEASQVVDKKTPLGVKKKGVEQKNDDKSDKSDKDVVSKDKTSTSKKGETSSKDDTKDKKDAKPATPTAAKVKKKWPFDKFEADTSADKDKGKIEKPAAKQKESPKLKTKSDEQNKSSTSAIKDKLSEKSNGKKLDKVKSPETKKKDVAEKVKSPGVKKKEVADKDKSPEAKKKAGLDKVKSPEIKKKVSAADKIKSPEVKKKSAAEKVKSPEVKKKDTSKIKEEQKSPVKTKTETDKGKSAPSKVESKEDVSDKDPVTKQDESKAKAEEKAEIKPEEDKPSADSATNAKDTDKAAELKTANVVSNQQGPDFVQDGGNEVITKSEDKPELKTTTSAAESETPEAEKKLDQIEQTIAEETKNIEPAQAESKTSNSSQPTTESTSSTVASSVNITLSSDGRKDNDNKSDEVTEGAVAEKQPVSPRQGPNVAPIEKPGGLIDMSEIGPLSPGITKEINGSKVIIEFRKRETPITNGGFSPGAIATGVLASNNQTSGQEGSINFPDNAEVSSSGVKVEGSNTVSSPAADAGSAGLLPDGQAGILSSGAPPDGSLSTQQPPVVTGQVGLQLQEAPEKSEQTWAGVGTPDTQCTLQAPGERDSSKQAGQDKNISPLTGSVGAEPRKDDPSAREAGSESEISPEITSTDSAVIHSKENSQVENDVSTNRKSPGPRSEEQAGDSLTPVTGEQRAQGVQLTPQTEVSTASIAVSTPESPHIGQEGSSSAPTTPVRVSEATITLTGSPDTPGGEQGGNDTSASGSVPGPSSDFTLPRSVEINPDQVIVHTGPKYHSAEEATTSFITDEGTYSPAQQTGVTSSIFHHQPSTNSNDDWYNQQRSQSDDDASIGGDHGQSRRRRRDRQQQVRRRQRQSYDDSDFSGGRYADSMSLNVNREDAMMEGTRMLIDNLREKVAMMEERDEKMQREKMALADLLSVKKSEYVEMKSKYRGRISDLEDDVNRLQSEKDRLLDKLKLPESERASLEKTDQEIAMLHKKIEELENQGDEFLDDNLSLKQEVKDLQLEMEEMHDQFREEEALEFRELQKELEATAKNCRILQFKLRKAERKNEQLENDRLHMEDKVRQMENRFSKSDDKQHIQELEEELKMAKEVSVRLHDELEMIEEKRARYEEELDRVNDILTESESRRQALQREVESLQDENDRIRSEQQDAKTATKNTLGVPARAPSLGQTKKEGSKEGSMEYDVAQLMRDLSDSLERENDLKEQLKFAEEEARIMRKKLSDMDEENESLTLQLQKISSAKSPKHFRKKDPGSGEVITEREHELKLAMELAENEVKVLKRKLNEMEQQNENLLSDVKFFQSKLEGKVDGKPYKPTIDEDERPLEEQITSMAKEIDTLKWKLTEQDIEAEDKMKGGRGILKKSKSLEEDMHQPGREKILGESQDLGAQLERVEQEANVLKDKLSRLEKENERLLTENKKLQLMSSRKVPSITTDDAALQNIELQERIAQLESENSTLRDSLRSLDDRTAQLSRQVSRASSSESLLNSEPSEARTLREQLRRVDEECKSLRRKVADLESSNIKLQRELRKHKREDDPSSKELSKLSKDQLKDRVLDLESELKGLITLIKNREDEIDKLEADIEGTKFDMDKLAEVFKSRENELVEEADMIQQKNNVLSNLLDLVTERAESTQKELEKYIRESEAMSTPTSPVSETLPEKEKKKKKDKDKVLVAKDWEENMKKRVESLEKTLAETKQKLEAKEKKLEAKDSKMSGIKRDTKVNKKEMEVMQKELALCTKQLKESMEEVKELKERLKTVQDSHKNVKDDYDKVYSELQSEKERYTQLEASHEEEKAKAAKEKKPEKEPASWRWEKKQLEDSVKELEKNVDKLKAELKQQHFKWKLAGEDKEKENKMKERLENQIQKLKDQLEENKTILDEAKTKADEIEKGFKVKEDQWAGERKILEDNAAAAEKESKRKDDALKLKDGIIEEKDELIKEKTKAVKDKEKSIKKKDEIIKSRDDEIKEKIKAVEKAEEDVSKAKTDYNNLKQQLVEKEDKLKSVTADIRRRDDRIKEKDEILDKINRKLKEKEQESQDMDNSIRQIMKKLQDKEVELKMLKNSSEKAESQIKSLTEQVSEMKVKLEESEKQQKKLQAIVEKNEKLESELSTLTKEKKALLSDLDNAKEKLKSGDEKWKKEKTKLELELKQNKEKLHSHELSRTMKQGEVVKTLSSEKEKLITEKHKLSDDINKLRKDFQETTKQWNSEREDLQKIISEKTKMIEDNNAICERMQKEMDSMKSKVKSSGGSIAIPIQVQHEGAQIQSFPVRVQTESDKKSKDKPQTEAPNGKEKELQIKLEQKELMFKAEKASLEELYEGRIKLSQENLAHSQDQVGQLKKENQAQLELLQSSRKALADLRTRYDAGLLSWNEERDRLEKKLERNGSKSTGSSSIDKQVKELQIKLDDADTKVKAAEVKLKAEQAAWKIEKAGLEKKIKAATAAPATGPTPGRPVGGVSEFRARFEKFESKKGPGAKASATAGAISTVSEDKAVAEAQKAVKELKKQLETLEKDCEKNKKELLEKVDKPTTLKKEKGSDSKEKKEIKERNSQLEEKLKNFDETSKSLVDLQCSMQEEREKWQIEKNQIFKQLEDTKQAHMSDKEKMNELLAELKKLRTLAPALDNGQDRRSRLRRTPSVERRKTSTVINLSADDKKDKEADDEVKRTLDQALEHISRLAEAFSQAPAQPRLRTSERKTQAPPQFRRSLSTSEIEEGLQTYVGKAPDSLVFHAYKAPTVKAAPSPVIIPKPPSSERSSRPREPRRGLSTENGEQYESATVDRRSFRAGAGQEHKRSSIHASGTMSAMTSRDASPEKGFRLRRTSPYPAAPPSMIITPSHTPRREHSVERSAEDTLSKQDMASLYAKLSEIETKEQARFKEKALQKERGKGIRVLTHSHSVDNALEEPRSPPPPPVEADQPSAGVGRSKYSDASESETLPASIRHSGLVITPGVEKFSLGIRKRNPGKQKRSASVSPKTARKQFYEDYPYDPKNIFSRLTRKMSTSDLSSAEHSRDNTLQKQVSAPAESLHAVKDEKGKDKSMFSSASNFFDAVKQKRKMFGSKRATSVDNSAVGTEIARVGTTVLQSPGAPSNYKPPEVPEPPEKKEEKKEKKSKRPFLHRRSASIDAGSLFSTRGSSRRSQSSDRQPLLPADTSSSDSRDRSRKQDGTRLEEERNSRDAADLEVVHIVAIPPLTQQFPKPLAPAERKPPRRWLSLKKAMLEQPIQIRDCPDQPPPLLYDPAFFESLEAWNFTETSV